MAESGLDPAATSWVDARSIMQLMPSTYEAISARRPELGAIEDPEWIVAAGIMHDRYPWKLWAKGVAGSAEQRAHIGQVAHTVPRRRCRETLDYVRKIDRHYAGFGKAR